MRLATIFAASGALFASSVAAVSQAALVAELTKLNLTSLVNAAASIQNTTAGKDLFTTITSGSPLTILAPTNAAFAGVNPFFGNDPTWLGQALAYHVIPGTAIKLSSIATDPNSSVYTTALKDTSLVHIGGKAQNLALVSTGGKFYIANQNSPSTISSCTTFQTMSICKISSVIDLPPSFNYAIGDLSQTYASSLSTLNSVVPADLKSTLTSTPSVTIFAPNNEGIQDAIAHGRISSSTNVTELVAILNNHVIKGQVLFTGKPQKTYTSAGGHQITFGTGGAFGNVVYYKGKLVADVVHGNVILQNGVMHVIDRVLADDPTKPAAKRTVGASRFFGKRAY